MSGKRLQLAIYRPHANIWFRNTVSRILRKDPIPNKYAPLLDYLLRADIELVFVSNLMPSRIARVSDAMELWLWRQLNGLHGSRLACSVRSAANCDVLFLMHYGNLTFETEDVAQTGGPLSRVLRQLPVMKVVHLTHFPYCSATGSANLVALRPDLLVAENNLAANATFFQIYFSSLAKVPFACLPYTPASRFQNRRPLDQRTNKMVVTGSITYKMQDPAFRSFFDTQELQPMRRRLYEARTNFPEEMDCLVSDLDATRAQPRHGLLRRIVTMGRRLSGMEAGISYYKNDIVETYNSYTMFSVPEEVCGLPAIGFVEGMACGAAYVGLVDPMYQDLGLQPGIHYIAYDGSVADLMTQVRFHQQHPEILYRIAKAGCAFVCSQFATEVVYGRFLAQLQQMVKSGRSAE